MKTPWYNTKSAVVSFHVLAWVLWFCLPVLFRRDPEPGQKVNWNPILNPVSIALNICWMSLFYLNANFLIGRFMNRRKTWQYAFILLGIYLVFLVVISFAFHLNKGGDHFSIYRVPYWIFFPFMFIWAISTVYRVVSDKIKTDQLLKEKENENLKTELSFLRSQVSPHFLFNVLNNMVAMARLKSDKLEPSIIKLSGLMRYMLYESDEQKVPVAREIEYVTSYIDLQRLRFGKDMKINVNMDPRGDSYLIEPMLLIPFIENAFKHGTGMIQDPEIDICLKMNNDTLDFRVKNKFNGDSNEIKDRTSGIGLANVRRRLNLLYGKEYQLSINKEDGWHTVSLQLKLQ
ncbi:MAG TPA: histidine kinase [Puia sp.]|nr:histidine kinase [Puia sp.]